MFFALHLPDHTLSVETTVAATGLALLVGAVLVRNRLRSNAGAGLLLIAAVAALVFAVQLVNFPLQDGRTSGHLLGSATAAILLGPAAGCAVMTFVLLMQAVLLGDGGVTVLGANVLNMGLVSPLAAWAAYQGVRRLRGDAVGTIAAAAVAGWVASAAAAVACAVQLAVSGIGPAGAIFAELVGQHALLGLVEGIVTAAVVVPAWLPAGSRRPLLRFAPLAAATAVALACLPVGSELPDTLEAVLEPAAHLAD